MSAGVAAVLLSFPGRVIIGNSSPGSGVKCSCIILLKNSVSSTRLMTVLECIGNDGDLVTSVCIGSGVDSITSVRIGSRDDLITSV